MNQPEQEQIEHWIRAAREALTQTDADLINGFYEAENISIQSVHTGTALHHATLARAKFLNGDAIAEVRAEFGTAARYVMKSFTMAYDSSDPDYQGENADLVEVSETIAIEGFDYALMAAEIDVAAALAGLFRDRPDGHRMDIEVNRYAHAMKHVLLDEFQQAKRLLDAQLKAYQAKPSKRRDFRMNYFTLSTALLGIAEKDETRFNDGLKLQLDFYEHYAQGEVKNTDEEFICDYAVALANLGIHHGLKVTVEHDTLPKGLLIQS